MAIMLLPRLGPGFLVVAITVTTIVLLLPGLVVVTVSMAMSVTQHDNQIRLSLRCRNYRKGTHCEENREKVFHVV